MTQKVRPIILKYLFLILTTPLLIPSELKAEIHGNSTFFSSKENALQQYSVALFPLFTDNKKSIRAIQEKLFEQEVRWQETFNYAIFIILVLVCIICVLLYRNNLRTKVLNTTLLDQQKKMLEQAEKLYEAHADITIKTEELESVNVEIQAINAMLESRVEERTKKLLQSRHELDVFLYRSSHDLRRPLTTLMGLVQVAKMDPAISPKALTVFDHVKQTAVYMDKMLNKLIMVSDLNAKVDEKNPADFNYFFHQLENKYRQVLQEKCIQLSYQIKGEYEWLIRPKQIQAIFENLTENAIEFYNPARTDCKIHFEIELEDKQIHIYAWDNGIGISEDIQSQVFDMFFRGSQSSHGNGLGLYVVQKIVENLGGSIHLESQVNLFTAFNIHIPRNSSVMAFLEDEQELKQS